MTKVQSVTIRFTKGFAAGGLAQIVLFLTPGVTISTKDDLIKLAYGVTTAFLIGGILALEKALSWKE